MYAAATDQRSGGRRQGGIGEASEPTRNIPTASLPRAGLLRKRRGRTVRPSLHDLSGSRKARAEEGGGIVAVVWGSHKRLHF